MKAINNGDRLLREIEMKIPSGENEKRQKLLMARKPRRPRSREARTAAREAHITRSGVAMASQACNKEKKIMKAQNIAAERPGIYMS